MYIAAKLLKSSSGEFSHDTNFVSLAKENPVGDRHASHISGYRRLRSVRPERAHLSTVGQFDVEFGLRIDGDYAGDQLPRREHPAGAARRKSVPNHSSLTIRVLLSPRIAIEESEYENDQFQIARHP